MDATLDEQKRAKPKCSDTKLEKKREYHRAYYQKNRERLLEQMRAYSKAQYSQLTDEEKKELAKYVKERYYATYERTRECHRERLRRYTAKQREKREKQKAQNAAAVNDST